MNDMNTTLYVYDEANLKSLKDNFTDYHFISIAYFFHRCDTIPELKNEDLSPFKNTVIDITNLVKDANYYRIFTERYLWILSEKIENLYFCINYKEFDSFIKSFPHMFDKQNFDFTTATTEIIPDNSRLIYREAQPLYVYRNIEKANELFQQKLLISLSDLIDECEGIAFRYNINHISDIINKEGIEYIDLSSIVKTLKVRSDLIFQFEILVNRISTVKEIKCCIKDALIFEIDELFPFSFSEKIYIDDNNCSKIKSEEKKTIEIDQVDSLVTEICNKLRGHDTFKTDFKNNMRKFYFLNGMGEKKILSIILCGYSGVGKTEFAKIISQTMFPNEPLIKINFGNYSSEGVLNSLIGSPLGYMGSEEGGELINKIKLSKTRIILIDEFEKATPSVFNFFYELLEDGVFTDRHGIAHNLNGYIIIFTSNMTQDEYHKHIPDSLKSRFDMVYYFLDLPQKEKELYIYNTVNNLIEKLKDQFGVQIAIENIQKELNELVKYKNLRDIKRNVEDIVINEFSKVYK